MGQSQEVNEASVRQRQASPKSPLHRCLMPYDYVAPVGFVKLIRPGVERSLGRKKAVDLFMRFQGKAQAVCGRCGASSALTIWTAADVRRYQKTVSPLDNRNIAVGTRQYAVFHKVVHS